MNNFFNISNDTYLSQRIKNIVQIIDNLSNENKDSIMKTQKYIDLLYKDLSNDVKLSIEKFQKLKPIVEELCENGKTIKTFENLKEEFKLIDFFIKKDKKLRIPFIRRLFNWKVFYFKLHYRKKNSTRRKSSYYS